MWNPAERQEFFEISLESWKEGYLIRSDQSHGVTTGKDVSTCSISPEALGQVLSVAMGASTALGGPAGSAVGLAIASAFGLKSLEITIADRGNGVHWPIT